MEETTTKLSSLLQNIQFPDPGVIQVKVSNPEKESDGQKDPHITYLLITKV
jgi:predicted metalloenzyme YecM